MELIELIFILIFIKCWFLYFNFISFISLIFIINSSNNINKYLTNETNETNEKDIINPFLSSIKKIYDYINDFKLKIYYSNIYLCKKIQWWNNINIRYIKINTYFDEYIKINKILLIRQFTNYFNYVFDEIFIKTKKNNIDINKIITNINNTIENFMDNIKNNNEINKIDKMIDELNIIQNKHIELYDSDNE